MDNDDKFCNNKKIKKNATIINARFYYFAF